MLQENYQCNFLMIKQEQNLVSILIELPDVMPASMNMVSIETVPFHSFMPPGIYAGETMVTQVLLADKKYLENEDIILWFNHRTYLPSKIFFKKLNQTIDIDMQFVRYPSSSSDSGAYIFAPRSKAIPLSLQIIDAKFMQQDADENE